MMITGDYHHTAIAVAKDVGMIKAEGKVLVIDTTSWAEAHRTSMSRWRSHRIDQRPAQRPLLTQLSFTPTSTQRLVSTLHRHSGCGSGTASSSRQVTWSQLPEDNLPISQHPVSSSQASVSHVELTRAEPDWQLAHREPILSPARTHKPHLLLPELKFSQGLQLSEALAALAEGQTQCAVTGEALDFLLQHHDVSVLDTVMRSAVVFSRMKPYQKGQVMDLLGTRGIQQLVDGQLHTIEVSVAALQGAWSCKILKGG